MPSITYRCIRCTETITEKVKGYHVCERGLCKPCTRKIIESCFDSTGQVEIYQRILRRVDRRRKKNGKNTEEKSSVVTTEARTEANRQKRSRAA